MKKQKKYRRQKKNSMGLSMVIGAGLILFGIAMFVLLQRAAGEASAAPPDRSVVPVAVNYPAPQLALENVQGRTESLEELRGQVLLLNNWATWCPPCKAEMPTLEKYYETHAAQGFLIIAVNAGEGQAEVVQFVNSFKLKFSVWLDPQGAALQAFKNGSLPNSYVIDRAGTVRYAWTGEINLAMLEKFVTPLIAAE